MPSRKQRRRRAKERRHDYEYVWVDESGEEVDHEAEPASASSRTNGRRVEKPVFHRGRKVDPPSWQRVLKRGLIFAPFMFLTMTFLYRGVSLGARIFQTLILLWLLIPFSYLMDKMMYRRFSRAGASAPPARRR